jgi:hypothetical protein
MPILSKETINWIYRHVATKVLLKFIRMTRAERGRWTAWAWRCWPPARSASFVPGMPTTVFWIGAVMCFLKTRPHAVRPLLRTPIDRPGHPLVPALAAVRRRAAPAATPVKRA